ncbi:MAG: LptF/LptG family permease [Pyrinomonadaceae bacterium]|nr:LptF/LptG family permease [Phycisphaerales bacterium]
MSTLDRYIARQYFTNILFLFVLLFSFVVTIDLALNLHRFINVLNETPGSEHLSLLGRFVRTIDLVWDLWWPRLLQLFVFLSGMVLVGAMGFTVSQLVRHRELVAMMAGGVSLRRVARPIVMVAAFVTLLQVIDQEFIIPKIAPLLTRDQKQAGKHALKEFQVPLTEDGQGRLFYAKEFNPATQTLGSVRVWERDSSRRMTRIISAPSAPWKDGAWVFDPATVDLTGAQVGQATAPSPGAAPARVTIATDLDPKALTLRHYSSFSQSLSWGELTEMLRTPGLEQRLHDRLIRIKYGRISSVISNFLSLLIVLPFFLMREPKNMVAQSLKCAPVGICALLGGVLGASAAIPGVPPGLGVFLPVILLTPIAVASMGSMRT